MLTASLQEYQVFNHRIVWYAAIANLELIKADDEDSKYYALGAMVLTFFAFEGYLNWLGVLIQPDVWKDERRFFQKEPFRGTLGKHLFLREHLGLPALSKETRPFSTAIMLCEVRNVLAHTKPEKGERYVEYTFPDYPPTYEGQLQTMINPDRAQMAREDIEDLANQLHAGSTTRYPNLVPESEPFCPLLAMQSTDPCFARRT